MAPIADESRERIYGMMAALLSHPDEGRWGRALNPHAQRRLIADADEVRTTAQALEYPLRDDELPADSLDLRCLVLELCQPLVHLKAEFERVLCGGRPWGCSPYELDHRGETSEYLLIEHLAGFATWYRAFNVLDGDRLPPRPDHVACELEFMYSLLLQRRLAMRLAEVDAEAGRSVSRCDLAQRNFFGDHLAGWLGSFAASLQACPSEGYLEPLGRFLAAWIPLERYNLGPSGGSLDAHHLDAAVALGC